jgi:DNA-binding response OmpR family regulator
MHTQPIHTQPVPFAGRDTRAERPAVLLADGGTDVHAIFSAALEREGYRVLHAFSAAECLRLAHAGGVSAALVSVGWCGLLTWRRLHDLAAEAASGGFSIVCLTTDPRLAPETRRLPPGTLAVLTLPCTPEVLAAEVRRAVGPRDAQPN